MIGTIGSGNSNYARFLVSALTRKNSENVVNLAKGIGAGNVY